MPQEIADKNPRIKREGGLFIPYRILALDITGVEKFVFAHILAFNLNEYGCFQSTETIALKIGFSAPAVKRAIYSLKDQGFIQRCESNGKSFLKVLNRLDQSDTGGSICTDDSGSNESEKINLIQDSDQSDPDIKHINKHNINTNTAADSQKDPNPKDEEKDPITKDLPTQTKETKTPSQKVSPKRFPRPDVEDSSLSVMMTDQEWDKFISQVGHECAFWWCSQLEDYAESQPKKFAGYKSHHKTLLKWHQMRCADGLVFGWTPQGGNGFYKHWVNGLKVGGKNG